MVRRTEKRLRPTYPTQVTPGGSLLNTLVGLSRLGTAAAGSRPLRIAMAGCVGGDDRLGGYVRQQLRGAGVLVVKSGRGDGGAAANSSGGAPDLGAVAAALQQRFPTPGAAFAAGAQGAGPAPAAPRATTGTVMVFCTPDAQRSFLSCIPNDDAVVLTPELMHAAARSRLLVVEGYLLDLPGADAALPRLVEVAKAAGTVVALTCGDAGIVGRSADTIAACLRAGLDLVFANKGEALALTAAAPLRALLLEASRCPDAALEFCPADNSVDATMGDEDDEEEVVALPVARNAAEAADQLSRLCPMVVVTDGSK
jgi:sugar/nucleoside kinase (ribokinase family)